MSIVEVVLIAVGLAMDAFAVSLGIGTTGQAKARRPIFRLSFHFGLFQCLMPILGWLIGSRIEFFVGQIDHWVAFGLLGFVGSRMIRSGLNVDGETYSSDPSRGRTLVMLAIATSIDAMAVGLSLAMLRVDIISPSIIIGIITGILSLIGLGIGYKLGETFGKRMEIIGGLLLVAIGVRILITHLM